MDDNELMVLVLDTRTSNKTNQSIKQRIDSGTCLACECQRKTRRGLCSKCYTRWSRTRAQMNMKDACQYDARLIRKGFLIASQQVRRIKTDCVFERSRK